MMACGKRQHFGRLQREKDAAPFPAGMLTTKEQINETDSVKCSGPFMRESNNAG